MKTKIKTEIEYEEAPCGYVTFYNYKEPLMKFEGGFGYIGALVFDGKTDKIQCHFCGEWLGSLPHHLRREHNMSASEYKDLVGLLQSTALISESARAKLIASGLDKRGQNLRAGGKKTQEEKDKIRATLIKNGQKAEHKNLRGTCPEQLIYRMKTIAEEKGDKLRMRDFDSFKESILKTYGTLEVACKLAGIKYHAPSVNYSYDHVRKYTRDTALNFIREYILRFENVPTYKDFEKQGSSGLYDSQIKNEKVLKEIATEALAGMDTYRKVDMKIVYTDEQLLNFLRKFEKINGRRPALSDAKRRLVPAPQNYYYHFGNWKNALSKAFND